MNSENSHKKPTNFIRNIINEDLSSGKHKSVITRFPPEPNGYLHIGHAKSICLNFGTAGDYDGWCNLRFDDTNPAKEEVEYVESIKKDVNWLGFNWDGEVKFSSSYFDIFYQCAEELILKEGSETIAGFVAEPVQGAGGVIPPSKNYFDLIQPILKNYNIPLVADEVICGFGRTGNLWGCETYNIKPDIIISSKCLTAGYFPMGAVIVNKEFADEFTSVCEEAEEFSHGFTAGGHPVGCAIALKAIDVIINEGLLENVKNVSPYFHERLQEFNEYKNIGETRGVGLMAALEMVKDKKTKEPFEGHLNMGDKVANMSIDNGLICRPLGPAIVLCPQFIINKKQIDEMIDSLHSTLKQSFN